jgi:murein DD-endopeptidase MepM/ murein hydrolase activator NlpD
VTSRCATVLAAALLFPCGAGSARADDLALDGAPEQGGLVRAKTVPGAVATLDGRAIRVAPDGQFIFGFGRDAPAHARLDITLPDGGRIARTLDVAPRHWDIQRIDGLPQQQVTPDPALLARIRRENEMAAQARAVDSDGLFFEAPLHWPATGPISGVFGSQRILNGEARQPHSGVDIAAPSGSPVMAAAAGAVTLAEPDFYLTGGTVIIDHGYGLSTTYMHLSAVAVKVGDPIAAGQEIGRVGATGRVTGPHLHWGLNWYEVRLDPMLAAGPLPPPPPASAAAARTTAPDDRESSAPARR